MHKTNSTLHGVAAADVAWQSTVCIRDHDGDLSVSLVTRASAQGMSYCSY